MHNNYTMLTLDYITNDVKALTLSNTIADVKQLFIESDFSHIPVVEEGHFYGLVSKNNIFEQDNEQVILKDVRFLFQSFFAYHEFIWLDLVKIFSINETTIIPVLNAENKYLGYYELSDILRYLSNTPFLNEIGNVIVVSKPTIDFSISEIAQIVESNEAKLYGVFISGYQAENSIITIKLYSDILNDVIHTFRRYDYQIIHGVNEDEYLSDLKQRSDYLQKYLNI